MTISGEALKNWNSASPVFCSAWTGGVKKPVTINKTKRPTVKKNGFFTYRRVVQMRRTMLRTLAFLIAGAPALLLAQYSEIKMGEYLHYAVAAANGGVYAGIDGIGYTTIFGTPSLYKTNTDWVDLPVAQGFNTALQITVPQRPSAMTVQWSPVM